MTLTLPTLRRASLDDLMATLNLNFGRRMDLIVNTGNIEMKNGQLVLTEVMVEGEGVARTVVLDSLPTFYAGLAEHTGIPLPYVKTLFSEEERRQAEALVIADAKFFGADDSLLDHNVNYWFARLGKTLMVRAYGDPDGGVGLARAMLSNKFRVFDNLDAIMPVLAALREAGIDFEITRCDLTDNGNMYVMIEAPGLHVDGGPFVHDYYQHRTGRSGRTFPLVHAGLLLRNGELGTGMLTLTGLVVEQVCTNGLMRNTEMKKRHVGARMDEGEWSEETHRKYTELVQSQVGDLCKTVFCTEWLDAQVAEINADAAGEIRPENVDKATTVLAKNLAWSQEERDEILASFIGGRMMSVGGFVQATTDVAQTMATGDAQWEMEKGAAKIPQMLAATGLVSA